MATLERPRRFATREDFLLGSGGRPNGNGGGIDIGEPPPRHHVRPVRRWTISETPQFLITFSAGTKDTYIQPHDEHAPPMLQTTLSPAALPTLSMPPFEQSQQR